MPSSFIDLRVRSGLFYWTFQCFMEKRQQPSSSTVRGVRFVPNCADFCTARFINMKTDCALFFFKQMTFRRSGKPTTGARFGVLTALFLGVFLAHFLLECMDVESNPGPPAPYRENSLLTGRENSLFTGRSWTGPWSQKRGLFGSHFNRNASGVRNLASDSRNTFPPLTDGVMRNSMHSADTGLHGNCSPTLREMKEDLLCLSENTDRRLNELKRFHSTLSTSVQDVETCHSLQAENMELRDAVKQVMANGIQQLQESHEHHQIARDNISVLYDWCQSLHKENNMMKKEMESLAHSSQIQTPTSRQSQAGAELKIAGTACQNYVQTEQI